MKSNEPVSLLGKYVKKMEVDLRRYSTIHLKSDFLSHLSAQQLVINQEPRRDLTLSILYTLYKINLPQFIRKFSPPPKKNRNYL